MDYLELANSPLMWLAAASCVSVVILQSVLFVRKSLSDGRKMGITPTQIKNAIRASTISSIGPACAIVIGIVPLLVTMGAPICWMRESVIGSVTYELMAAGFGADAMGATLGGEGMTSTVFAAAAWVMSLGSVGWLLFTAFFTPKLEQFRNVLAGGRKALVPVVSSAAMLGAFAYLDADRILQRNQGSVACIVGFFTMAILMNYARKKNVEFLKEWSLTISMVVGMIAGAIS